MKQIPAVKAVMTPFPHCVESRQTVSKAREILEEHGIHHLPVVEDGTLVGVLTDRDVKLATGPVLAPVGERELRVRDLITTGAYVVELTEPLDVVALHMARERIDCAVVVKNRRPVGIFTMTDACRCLGSLLQSLFPRGEGDDAA